MSVLNPHGIRSRLFELTSSEWAVLCLGATTFVSFVALIRVDVTLWPAMGLFFSALVFGHMCMTASRLVAFPDLIALAACVQWVVAPWLADAYPPSLSMFRNALPANEYLPFALPATVMLWVGLHLAPSRYLDGKSWHLVLEPLQPRARRALDGIIVLGIIASTYLESAPPSFAFLVYLLASFRFFAALGWMVTQTPGWHIRVAVVFALLLFEQTASGVFYLVVHWGGYFMLLYAFMRGWRWKLGVVVLVGLMGLGFLQQIKPAYRQQIDTTWYEPVDAVKLFGQMVWDRIRGEYHPEVATDVGDTLVRFNQGWIISRIMTHVPHEQPHANGGTIVDAVVFSVLPRFLFPWKASGVSHELFTTYTGITLRSNTNMGLGIIGEMYANFGFWGGILATFGYGLGVGLAFTFFARRALLNPLWWAVGSIVLLPAVEPGINIEDIMNHVVKGSIVLLALWKLLPAMQRLLTLTPQMDHEADYEEDEYEQDESSGFHDRATDRQVPYRL